MAFFGGQYAVTASAVSVAAALAIDTDAGKSACQQLHLQYASGALNAAFAGPSTVTNVPANAAFQFPVVAANIPPKSVVVGPGAGSKALDLNTIFLVGTANAANIFFIGIVY